MWDFIIVGAGSAGCALAYALAQGAPDRRILILEAGAQDRSPFIKVPAGQLRAIGAHDWGYQTEPDDTRHGREDRWWRGRVVGGCSSINGTMYVRGAAHDFDRWNAGFQGWNGPGWSAQEVLPLYQEIERAERARAHRSAPGPMHVRTVRNPHPLSKAFVEAAAAAGHPLNPNYNGAAQEGVGLAQLSQKGRFRCSAADAFLRPISGRRNVRLMTGAHATAITFDGQAATGVTFRQGGGSRTERGRQVILCGGAINTPQLLMLSGIGDPAELAEHGIPVRRALPGVGRNLMDHPLVGFTYRTRVPSFNLTGGAGQSLGFTLQYLVGREGPLANPFEATAFLRSSPGVDEPDLQLHFLPVGYFVSDSGRFVLQDFPSATVLLNLSYPRSRGRIRLRTADPFTRVRITHRLFEDPRDLETLIDGVGRVREIMQAKPMADLVEAEVFPGALAEGRSQIRDYVRRFAGTAYHPVGTCRMGLDDLAVVTPDLRVRGVDNLWVADASIMPDLISGNTNAACLMIGAKLGKQLSAL